MTSKDTIDYKVKGFDNKKYLLSQSEAITQRVEKFKKGRLYLEIGGKFLFDPHAARVLPGFDPQVKVEIIKNLKSSYDIIYCVSLPDIISNRSLSSDTTTYLEYTDKMLLDYENMLGIKPVISLNLVTTDTLPEADKYKQRMQKKGYSVYYRYVIPGYPNSHEVVSQNGYGKDEHITGLRNLVLVVGAASNSGKMSTCLGQMYHDHQNNEESGYAKYETFPIWDLPIHHPVNLAYEAATVDIGDFNMIDRFHLYSYGITSVNYNRDVAAFVIIQNMKSKLISKDNHMNEYKSPTDMGVNTASQGVIDDEIIAIAGYQEILRRKEWYKEEKWRNKCDTIAQRAMEYIVKKKYSLQKVLS